MQKKKALLTRDFNKNCIKSADRCEPDWDLDNSGAQKASSCLCVFLCFFPSFPSVGLAPLWLGLFPKYFALFYIIVNGIISLISFWGLFIVSV